MKRKRIGTYSAIGFIAVLLIYGILFEPNLVEIRHVWVEDRRLANILQDKIVVHLSDLHIGKIGRREQNVLNILNDLGVDFVFLTGDYVPWDGDYEEALIFLSRIKAKIGVWAVMGDYDYSSSRKSCLFCHAPGTGKPSHRHPVKFLRNSAEEISLPEGNLLIGAIDKEAERPFFSEKNLNFVTENNAMIILAHDPLAFDLLKENQEVLMLAGDTHGGQIPLPTFFWKILGYEKNAHYNEGLFQEGQKKMFVSRGIGTSHFPFRFLRRPEVVVLHFK